MSPERRRSLRRLRRRWMFHGLRALVRGLGFARMRALGALLGMLQFHLDRTLRLKIQQDLAVLLGRSPSQVRPLLAQAYRVNTRAVLEVLALFHRPPQAAELQRWVGIAGVERLDAALAGGRGVILLGTHSGNALLAVLQLAAAGRAVSVVYRQARMMSDELFEQGLGQAGIEAIRANDGIKAYGRMLLALRQNRIVFLMLDQGVQKARDGIRLRFLGKDMPISGGPAQLARHGRAPVLPLVTVDAEPCWQFAIDPPVERVAGASLEADTEQLLRLCEQQVLQRPQLWSWPQRRWRKFALAS